MTRRATPVRVLLLLALLLASCSGSGLRTLTPRIASGIARVSVEVLSGFPVQPPLSAASQRVEILLDVTASMNAHTAPGRPRRYAAAREAAANFVARLPASNRVGASIVGSERAAACSTARSVPGGRAGREGAALQAELRGASPRSEASLAAALDGVGSKYAGALDGLRVVVFSDLGGECGGDLCLAGEALARDGARLDLVLFGDAPVPRCFVEFEPDRTPKLESFDRAAAPPMFRVSAEESRGFGEAALASGPADGSPVVVSAGPVVVVVELDPPAVIGPIDLEPDTLTRVRVIDFPGLDPHQREWRWDIESPSEVAAAPSGVAGTHPGNPRQFPSLGP